MAQAASTRKLHRPRLGMGLFVTATVVSVFSFGADVGLLPEGWLLLLVFVTLASFSAAFWFGWLMRVELRVSKGPLLIRAAFLGVVQVIGTHLVFGFLLAMTSWLFGFLAFDLGGDQSFPGSFKMPFGYALVSFFAIPFTLPAGLLAAVFVELIEDEAKRDCAKHSGDDGLNEG